MRGWDRTRGIGGLVEPPEALEQPARAVQRRVAVGFQAMPDGVEEFLRGRSWLGHPLHPILTDLPSGCWTAAWFFDLLETVGVKRLRPAGDACIAVGLAAVPPTALAGLADWHALSGPARRIGFLHAGINGVAGLVYSASLFHRLRGQRAKGHIFGHLGFVLLNVSAYLGGEMVYDAGAGVVAGDEGASTSPPRPPASARSTN